MQIPLGGLTGPLGRIKNLMRQPEQDQLSVAHHHWDGLLFLVILHLIWSLGVIHVSQRNQLKPLVIACARSSPGIVSLGLGCLQG